MSDSDNYFSDSEKSNNEEDLLENGLDEMEEYEMDEETLRIIYDSARNRNKESSSFEVQQDSSIKKKKKKVREVKNKSLSLFEYQQKVEDEKPKKWKSKRFNEKKEELGIVKITRPIKREFNPRLPIPTYETFRKKGDEYEDIDVNDGEMFPELSPTAGVNIDV